jgi:hypothetical protein
LTPSTDTLYCVARVSQAIVRVNTGPGMPYMRSKDQKTEGCAQRVCNRLCQIGLHHVFTCPLEGLGPACQVQTSCFSGTQFWANRCLDLSCHGCRIGQEHPGRLKLGLLVLLTALYKVHCSLLISDICFWFSGAPKMSLRSVFQSLAVWWPMGQMHHKLAQFVGHGRLLNLFFGSSQTDVWLPRYGHFKFWGGVVLQN